MSKVVAIMSMSLDGYVADLHATPQERSNWRLIGRGEGLHWPDLDEDVSVGNLILGQPSGESQRSLQRWLSTRAGGTDRSPTS